MVSVARGEGDIVGSTVLCDDGKFVPVGIDSWVCSILKVSQDVIIVVKSKIIQTLLILFIFSLIFYILQQFFNSAYPTIIQANLDAMGMKSGFR
jgi:hypothetical protein